MITVVFANNSFQCSSSGLIQIYPGTGDEAQYIYHSLGGFPGGSDSKESACNAGEPLKKGMATHSSILASKIPRTEDPGGLQSKGLQKVRND